MDNPYRKSPRELMFAGMNRGALLNYLAEDLDYTPDDVCNILEEHGFELQPNRDTLSIPRGYHTRGYVVTVREEL